MHILMVTPGFAASETDTTCIPPLYLFVKELTKQNPDWRISIIAVHYPFTDENYSFYGSMVYPINGRNKRNLFSREGRRIKIKNLVKKLDRSNKIDIVHSFWLEETAFNAALIAKKHGIPHIATLMGQDAGKANKYAPIILKRLKVDKLILLSEFQKNVFEKAFMKNSDVIIPWGIDEIFHSDLDRDIDIIGVGSLIDLKDFKRFIEIIQTLKTKFPSIKVKIIGKGKFELDLKRQIDTMQLNQTIEITGELQRWEVIKMMQRAKLFLHTSNYESFGYVLLEALSSGCQVVSTPVGFAYNNPDIYTYETNKEAVEIAEKSRSSTLKKLTNIPMMKTTVQKYSEIYNNLITQ